MLVDRIHIGIIGTRRRDSNEDLQMLLDRLIPILEHFDEEETKVVFVSGGCPQGGDRFAEIIAKQFDIPIIIYYPDKSKLPQYPERRDIAKINFERNTLIARDSNVLIAIVAGDRTGGTEDTIKKFKKMYPKRPIVLI